MLSKKETKKINLNNSNINLVEQLNLKWEENYTAIAMSCSNEYVPYLSVCLQSLKEHASTDHNYDIIIFERSITDENKIKLKDQIEEKNISLRFVNPMDIISKYNLKFPAHYNLECYFRLTSPLILNNYKKLIFTDVDLIFQRDVKDLYAINIEKALGACQDLIWCALLDTPKLDWLHYSREVLELDDPYKYFNTGVMILNLDYLREYEIPKKLLSMANEKTYRILEQDILNKFLKDNITYIDDIWNFPTLNKKYKEYLNNTQEEYQKRYAIAKNNPAVIHWAGFGKAWNDPDEDLAHFWWVYARKTPFYEKILVLLNKYIFQKEYIKLNSRKIYIEYCFYKILSKVAFGKYKNTCKDRAKKLKVQIRIIRNG